MVFKISFVALHSFSMASPPPASRVFPSPGRGGLGLDPSKTACLFIEFQNEFATLGGKLHGKVREQWCHHKELGEPEVCIGLVAYSPRDVPWALVAHVH